MRCSRREFNCIICVSLGGLHYRPAGKVRRSVDARNPSTRVLTATIFGQLETAAFILSPFPPLTDPRPSVTLPLVPQFLRMPATHLAPCPLAHVPQATARPRPVPCHDFYACRRGRKRNSRKRQASNVAVWGTRSLRSQDEFEVRGNIHARRLTRGGFDFKTVHVCTKLGFPCFSCFHVIISAIFGRFGWSVPHALHVCVLRFGKMC